MTKQSRPRQQGRILLWNAPIYPVQLYRVVHEDKQPKPLPNLKHWMPEYGETLTLPEKAKTK